MRLFEVIKLLLSHHADEGRLVSVHLRILELKRMSEQQQIESTLFMEYIHPHSDHVEWVIIGLFVLVFIDFVIRTKS